MPLVISVRSRLSRRETAERIRQVVLGLQGREQTPYKEVLAGSIAWTVALENLADFEKKSAGLSDRFGLLWAPLAPSTIARKIGKWKKQLTPAKARKLAKLIDRFSRQGGPKMTAAQTRQRAIRLAWQQIAGRVPINVDTGRLKASLTPSAGLLATLTGTGDQIARVRQNALEFGSAVPYAKYTHFGTNRQPARPVLPPAAHYRGWVRDGVVRGLPLVFDRLERTELK